MQTGKRNEDEEREQRHDRFDHVVEQPLV